jgi:hypothetical protein
MRKGVDDSNDPSEPTSWTTRSTRINARECAGRLSMRPQVRSTPFVTMLLSSSFAPFMTKTRL